MPIKHHQGNLLDSSCSFIVHGTNCFHTMGSGIAKQIRLRYPQVYKADCRTIKGDQNKLGTYSVSTTMDPVQRSIINMYTQYNYGKDRIRVDYTALRTGFTKLSTYMNEIDYVMEKLFPNSYKETLGVPRIGCGLAGGNWDTVENILEECFPIRTVNVYTL